MADKNKENDEFIPVTSQEQAALEGILQLFIKSAHIDFSHYRQTTVLRRIARRISLSNKNNYVDYLTFLENNPNEVEQLYDDLLLSHTEFFRDPAVFEALKGSVFPGLVSHRTTKTPIRIWVAGCSTGEEVYSLAIALHEYITEHKPTITVQFFGTDLNLRHITTARKGLYSEKIRKTVSKERLALYFDETSGGLQVTKQIREMCVFAVQDVTQDPPFPSIDLVSCRNVLIYFDATLQEIVLPLFHFALKSNGFLLLGSSESMGKFTDLFLPANEKINLYTKRFTRIKPLYHFPVSQLSSKLRGDYGQIPIPLPVKSIGGCLDIKEKIDTILDTFVPPSLVVDCNMLIRQFRGDTSPYVTPASGEASLKLSKMASSGLMPDIYVAIEEAKRKKEKVTKKNISFRQHDSINTVTLTIFPITDPSSEETCFLITFEKQETAYSLGAASMEQYDGADSELMRLKNDLQSTKEHLQSIVDEKDEVNQEMWAANEEIQSTNEELQSVNEEMEAAKEELEASNEELVALNEELRAKNIDLKIEKDYSENIVDTAKAIILTIDVNGRIKTFNNFATELTGYSETEVIGKEWTSTFIPQEERDSIAKVFKDVLCAMPEFFIHENLILTKNRSERLIRWSNSLMRDPLGEICGILSIGMDITDHQRMEEELQKTQKLESLGILAGGIAHDFNNLLSGLFGYIEVAQRHSKDEKITHALSKALATMDRARGLTSQLLTFSKGGSPIRKVGKLIPFIQETAQFALSGANVSCSFDIQDNLSSCNFDKNQIGQVIDNIIINAQQAMLRGGKLEVAAHNVDIKEKDHPTLYSGRYIRISIKDYGVGIPKELLTRIFDPFFSTKAKGHGLGLATCYSIIKRHSGCIEVESEIGKGSTFHVYLPASVESLLPATEPMLVQHMGSGTFLIMDDEEIIRDVIGEILKSLGYTVVCKQNGKDAIDFLESEIKAGRKISGMIFDLTIPGGMGGREAITEVRKLDKEIPVFVASGYAQDPVMSNPTKYGFTASICKPFITNDLVEMLNSYKPL
jgi:two-component system CheB/CheR fusion protein